VINNIKVHIFGEDKKTEEIHLLVLALLRNNVKLKRDFFKSLLPFKKSSTLHFQAGLYKKEDSCTTNSRNRSRNEGNETLYSARALQLSNSKGTQEVCSKTFIRVIEYVTDTLKINISSVVEFQRWCVLKSKLFGQELTYVLKDFFFKSFDKKVSKSYFQSQFWISKSNRIFSKKSFI
jgi:hypothetical protein